MVHGIPMGALTVLETDERHERLKPRSTPLQTPRPAGNIWYVDDGAPRIAALAEMLTHGVAEMITGGATL